jgi:hypothetical protein
MKKWFSRNTLIVVSVLGLLASLVSGREKPAVEVMQEKKPRTQAVEDIDLSRLERTEAKAPAADPFAPRAFGSQKEIHQKPEKQSAPPLPFRYFGKVIEDGKLEVFVLNGEETVGVKAGAKVGDYRVDKVSESSITFTYLPLNTRQTLDIPAVN